MWYLNLWLMWHHISLLELFGSKIIFHYYLLFTNFATAQFLCFGKYASKDRWWFDEWTNGRFLQPHKITMIYTKKREFFSFVFLQPQTMNTSIRTQSTDSGRLVHWPPWAFIDGKLPIPRPHGLHFVWTRTKIDDTLPRLKLQFQI